MDTYEYKGRNKRGEIMQGTIESPNAQAVASWMVSAGIAPTHIAVQESKFKDQPRWLRTLQGGGSLDTRELLLFTRQMGTMVKAGVPMLESLAGIQKSSANQSLIEVLRDIRADLEKGITLSGAMAHHPKFFDEYYVSMIRVGESSGRLEEVFKRLFDQLVFQKLIKHKIKSALRYPTFVVVAISVALAIMTLFVIPAFAKFFTQMKAQLPLMTRILLGTSDFAINYWWAVAALIAGAIYAFKLFTDLPEGRYAWDKFKLKIPIAGGIVKKATLARFCNSFASASMSGVPIVQAFTLVSRVVDNAFYEERILLMRDGVERGESMLRAAQTADIFTPLELQMIAVGEETGDLDGMLNQVADMYREEVEFEISRMSETIEPILLAFVGVLVLILMLGIFMPMWDLGNAALKKR